MIDVAELEKKVPILKDIQNEKEVFWINPDKTNCEEAMKHIELTMADVDDAEQRLKRFAPFIMKCFPETKDRNGMIESVLTPIPGMKELLNEKYNSNLEGTLLLKQDSHLAIAGSIKARGGIYEVLKHTEELALEHGFLKKEDNYEKLASEECRQFFRNYTIQVGSTGNLGMSIGIMSAAVGYQVIVHMSADAKQWKKDLLRRDLSRVLSAKCNRFAYTYNRQGFLCKFSLLTLLMIATEPIPVPEELRQVQAHQGGLDEVVSGEIRCGYRPPPAGADAGQALGQGYGAVRDFPFPAASGKMKSVLRAAPRWDKVSQSRGHDRPTQLLDTLSSQRIENG